MVKTYLHSLALADMRMHKQSHSFEANSVTSSPSIATTV